MRYLKTFENFTQKQLSIDISDVYGRIKLYEVSDKIYAVVIKDPHLRAMTFLRVQEYYESGSDQFKGKRLDWEKYMKWYKSREAPNAIDTDVFTYGADWSGFNLPSDVVEKCMSDIDSPNTYDHIMLSIIKSIRETEKGKFYLLGCDDFGREDKSLLDHELAHGFYYIEPSYKSKMDILMDKMNTDVKNTISEIILGYGYSPSVLSDEIQAYMSTGLSKKMLGLGIERDMSPFESVFLEVKKKNDMTPLEIKIKF